MKVQSKKMSRVKIVPLKYEKDAIKTLRQYRQAMARLEEIFQAKKGTPEGKEANTLSKMVCDYEEKHWPIKLTKREQ